MDIGFCLPYMKNGLNRELVQEWCMRTDKGPFSTLSCGERITGPQEVMDMRVTLAFAAAITERVKIMPSLYVLPMHSTAMVAQEVATLDRLSNGRVQVCVGVGSRRVRDRQRGVPRCAQQQRPGARWLRCRRRRNRPRRASLRRPVTE